MCGSVCFLRKGVGVTVAVVAAVLLAITAIAIAAIFAPPFFATALLASAALPVAISAGIGALVAIIAAVVLLKKPMSVAPEELEDDLTVVGEKDLPPVPKPFEYWDQLIKEHKNFSHFGDDYKIFRNNLANISLKLEDRPIAKVHDEYEKLKGLMDAYVPLET